MRSPPRWRSRPSSSAPPLFAPWAAAVGNECSEAPNHLWTLWAAAESLQNTGPFLFEADMAFPDGCRQHVMDPIDVVAFSGPYWLFGRDAAAAHIAWNGLLFMADLAPS